MNKIIEAQNFSHLANLLLILKAARTTVKDDFCIDLIVFLVLLIVHFICSLHNIKLLDPKIKAAECRNNEIIMIDALSI